MKNIRITFTESDLQDLENGETFDWTFDGVNVHLCRADYSCEKCGEDIEAGAEHEGENGDMYCINCAPEPITEKDVIRDTNGDEVEQ